MFFSTNFSVIVFKDLYFIQIETYATQNIMTVTKNLGIKNKIKRQKHIRFGEIKLILRLHRAQIKVYLLLSPTK